MIIKNKQTLLILKKKCIMVKKSRKLLDEKLNGLIRAFRQNIIEGYQLEEKVKKESGSIIGDFLEASSFISSQHLLEFVKSNAMGSKEVPYQLETSNKKFFGVKIPSIELQLRPQLIDNNVKPKLANSLKMFNHRIPFFLKLSQIRIKCQLIADEISKTNRLLANLDKNLQIINTNIKDIQNSLLEKENATKAVLIKLFN